MKKRSLKTTKMKNPMNDGSGKQKTITATQTSEVICFICDDVVIGKGVPLLMTHTPYSNTDLPTKIGQLMGDGFMVIVAVTDVLCKRCSSLISQLDKLENDTEKIKSALTGFLKLKYELSEELDVECGSDSQDGVVANSNVEDQVCIQFDEISTYEEYSRNKDMKQSLDVKCDFVACHAIKTENLKMEECDSLCDAELNDLDSLEREDNYEVQEAEDSLIYGEADEGTDEVTLYRCNSCSFSAPVLDTLICHLKIHSKKHLYKCSECHQKFETQEDVIYHIGKDHKPANLYYNEDIRELENDPDYYPSNQKVYECSVCKYHHNNKKIFDAHMRKHLKPEKFTCSICSKVFKHKITLKKHMCSHRVYKCGLCSALFQNKASLAHHFKIHNFDINNDAENNEKPEADVQDIDVPTLNDQKCIPLKEIKDSGERNEELCSGSKVSCTTGQKTEYDQVEVLLERMHSDDPENCKSSVCAKDVDKGINEQKKEEVNKDGTDVSTANVPLQNCSTAKTDNSEDQQIEDYLEKSDKYMVESQSSLEDTANKKNVETTKEIVAVLENDSENFKDLKCIDSVANTDHESDATSKENKENVEFDALKNTDDIICKIVSTSDGHKSVSKKLYMCTLCGLRTVSETHIKRHFKSHIALEKKTYKCHICERVLTTRSNLKRHISLHESCSSGEVECNMCNELLTDRLHLKHHMELKHPESYQCSFCDRRFDSKKACHDHELTHPALQCDVCQKMFLTEGRLKSHKLFMHSESGQPTSKSKVFKCHICFKILTTYHNLKRHLRNHEKCSGAVRCVLCNEELTDKLHLRQHVEEKHPENHQCSFCHKVFGNRKTCKAHELSHPERFVYKCESCDKLFLTESRMKRHQDIMHRDPHCRVCGKEISNPLKLLDHERRHERHKVMFPCDQCPKVFRTPSGLKYHMSVHTGKYAVYCEICGKGLHSEVVLEEHKATHTKEVRYTCEKCGRTFSSNSTYRMHRLWHDNPLPYKCNICDRKFKHTSILAVHKRRAHTGERPYKCPHCNLTFSVSSTLNKHIILHTKEYPYRCEQCEKGFTTRTKIARHMAKVHNDFEMLNSKKKACEYKMVLHPSELSGGTKDNAEEALSADGNAILSEKLAEEKEETQAATLQVLEHVTVDPAQAAIFTIFQQDLPSSEFTLHEFEAVTK